MITDECEDEREMGWLDERAARAIHCLGDQIARTLPLVHTTILVNQIKLDTKTVLRIQ